MKSDRTIQKAILDWRTAKGLSYAQAGELCGDVAGTTVSDWENNVAKNIRNSNWKYLFPLIKPYLPPERIGGTLLTGEYYFDDKTYSKRFNEDLQIKQNFIKFDIKDLPPELQEFIEAYNKLDSKAKRSLAYEKIQEIVKTLKKINDI